MRTFKIFGFVVALFMSILLIQSCVDDACSNVTCQNGGECTDGACNCPDGYTGDLCQFAECSITECPANATCETDTLTGAGVCVCNPGYEGDQCQTECRAKFLGSYNVDDPCQHSDGQTATYAWSTTVTTSASGVTSMVFSNFGGFEVNVTAVLDDCDTFSIPEQTVAGGRIIKSITSATRNATTGQFSLTYRVTFTDNSFDECDPVFTPQ